VRQSSGAFWCWQKTGLPPGRAELQFHQP
jgi:hypothetical protein